MSDSGVAAGCVLEKMRRLHDDGMAGVLASVACGFSLSLLGDAVSTVQYSTVLHCCYSVPRSGVNRLSS